MDLTKIYDNNTKDKIILYFFYVNSSDEIYSIKNKIEFIEDGNFLKERQLYLIKENQFNLFNKHKLISLSYTNFNINKDEIQDFINGKINKEYFKSLELLDDIKFKESLDIFSTVNCIFFIFKVISKPENNTRRILLNTKKRKTRRVEK